MYCLGLDIGYSTVKLVLIDEQGKIKYSNYRFHKGKISVILQEMLIDVEKKFDVKGIRRGAVSGSGKEIVTHFKGIQSVNDVTALVEGIGLLEPTAGSVIELGGQSAKFVTAMNSEKQGNMEIAMNSNCSAGTGSFLEEQIHRLNLEIEDYSVYALKAKQIPRIAGRCSVFAKTDIIHHQQEGVPIEDVLLGLAYSVAKNFRSTIIGKKPIHKPLVLVGGVAHNKGMIKAFHDILKLEKDEMIVPKHSDVVAALGAAKIASGEGLSINWEDIKRSIKETEAEVIGESGLCDLVGLGDRESDDKHILNPEVRNTVKNTYLGVDIGSTSTNLLIIDEDGEVVAFRYVKTLGDPVNTVKNALVEMMDELGEDYRINGIGTTGSGRYMIGQKLGATVIKDEITAQATATLSIDPEIDTIIEIGGQDSKFISLENGAVKDFQMNKICAAGTGAFIEEQAKKLGIPLNDFGGRALKSGNPLDLGERCTVFIESCMMEYMSKGADDEDLAAGLCYSVAKNYLNKVVGQRKIGKKISFQGGVAYNQGVVNAFKSLIGKDVHILPFFSVTGAYGVAKLSSDAYREEEHGETTLSELFHRLDTEEIQLTQVKATKVMRKQDQLTEMFFHGYTETLDENKPTVGIPRILFLHKLFPAFNIFFRELGFNTILTDLSTEETVALSQEYAAEDTCYPIKLVHGHVAQLIEKKVDYIFLPSLLTMKHEISKTRRDYGCVYMQTVSELIRKSMNLDEKGITLLAPTLSFNFGKKYMMKTMLELGQKLGKNKVSTVLALQKGMKHLTNYMKAIEKVGAEKVNELKEGERAFVIITRAYGIIDPILNMGIPEKLTKMGHQVLTLSHLPGHDVDLQAEYPNMYWPFGQHMISGAQIIKNHPNLYAIYLTNHGCGPDTIISKYMTEEMGDKPFLHIEVDEHASSVGVITRIEAFINSLDQVKSEKSSAKVVDINTMPETLVHKKVNIVETLSVECQHKQIKLPYMYPYANLLVADLKRKGLQAEVMKQTNKTSHNRGLEYTTTKESFSLTTILGDCLEAVTEEDQHDNLVFMVPKTLESEVYGQYNRVLRTVLDQQGYEQTTIYAPYIEDIIYDQERAKATILNILAGDLIQLLPLDVRQEYLDGIEVMIEKKPLDLQDVMEIAKAVIHQEETDKEQEKNMKRLLVVGEPLVLYNSYLNQNVLDNIEKSGHRIDRAPLSEYVLMLWREFLAHPQTEQKGRGKKVFAKLLKYVNEVQMLLGDRSPFAKGLEDIESPLNHPFASTGGVYRMCKSQAVTSYDGIIEVSSMYENTNAIVQILQSKEEKKIPKLNLSFDGTANETLNTKIESFMYYL